MAKIRLQALHALASRIATELRKDLPKSITVTKSEQRKLDKMNEIKSRIHEFELNLKQISESLISEDKILDYSYNTYKYILIKKQKYHISENEIYNKLLINTEFEKEPLESIVAKIKQEYLSK